MKYGARAIPQRFRAGRSPGTKSLRNCSGSVLLASSVLAFGSFAAGQTVHVPPVVVDTLTHTHLFHSVPPPAGETITRDMVTFPCTGGACNGPGFTATIGQGSTIVLRIEAPAGNKFVVTRLAGGTQTFASNVHWQTNSGDSTSSTETPTITFENLTGTAPANTYALNVVTDHGETVLSENAFNVTGDFSFTALRLEFTVTQPVSALTRTYNAVDSYSVPSFGTAHTVSGMGGDATVMAIVPLAFTSLCDPGAGGVIPCPCANAPVNSGRGCNNSAATGGANLSGGGVAHLAADTLFFTTAGEKPTATSILMQGTASPANGVVYGQGVRCVGGSLKRLFVKAAVGGSILAPNFAGGDPSVSARSAAKGDTILAGQNRWYLVYYRDPTVLGGCPSSSTFNATQTGLVTWTM